ncbi:hypothetical protein ABK040_016226 [Willaertia magna]
MVLKNKKKQSSSSSSSNNNNNNSNNSSNNNSNSKNNNSKNSNIKKNKENKENELIEFTLTITNNLLNFENEFNLLQNTLQNNLENNLQNNLQNTLQKIENLLQKVNKFFLQSLNLNNESILLQFLILLQKLNLLKMENLFNFKNLNEKKYNLIFNEILNYHQLLQQNLQNNLQNNLQKNNFLNELKLQWNEIFTKMEFYKNKLLEKEYENEIVKKCHKKNICVLYKNENEGKIVVTKINTLQNEILFMEITVKEFPFLENLFVTSEDYNNLQQKKEEKLVYKICQECDNCNEVFCSKKCLQNAMKDYHILICTKNKCDKICDNTLQQVDNILQQKSQQHPIELLEKMCQLQKRGTPLMIAKMLSIILMKSVTNFLSHFLKDLQNGVFLQNTLQNSLQNSLQFGFHEFSRFIQSEMSHDHDTLAIELIKESFVKSIFVNEENCKEISLQFLQQVTKNCNVTIPIDNTLSQNSEFIKILLKMINIICDIVNYRSLNGLILRNCTTIHPITEIHEIKNHTLQQEILKNLHKPLDNTLQKNTQMIDNNCDNNCNNHCDNWNEEFLQNCKEFNELSLQGMGAFTIHNCINHSCIPNIVTMSNQLNHNICVKTLQNLKEGDELFISYVDENLPYLERKEKLLEQYLFECRCNKCLQKL